MDSLTVKFIVLVVAIVTVYDVWTLARRGYTTTISWVIYKSSTKWPVIAFVSGFLCGHLFFGNAAPRMESEQCPSSQLPEVRRE